MLPTGGFLCADHGWERLKSSPPIETQRQPILTTKNNAGIDLGEVSLAWREQGASKRR